MGKYPIVKDYIFLFNSNMLKNKLKFINKKKKKKKKNFF